MATCVTSGNTHPIMYSFYTLRPGQNGRHFPDDIFKGIFLNENVFVSLKISMKFAPEVQINNISAMVQIMAWPRPGDKPLSEQIMVRLLTHICVTRPQWVKTADWNNLSCKLSITFWISKILSKGRPIIWFSIINYVHFNLNYLHVTQLCRYVIIYDYGNQNLSCP